MKQLLIISLMLNLWFQFNDTLFYTYVDFVYCPNSESKSVQSGQYSIFGFELFKINYVIEPEETYSTVTCFDGTNNAKINN